MKRTVAVLLAVFLWATGAEAADRLRIGYSSISGAYVGKIIEKAPYINMVAMQNAIEEVAKTIPAAKNAKPEQFVDMRFLDKLEISGLLNELYK